MGLVSYGVDVYGNYMWPQIRFMNYVDEHNFGFMSNQKWNNRDFDATGARVVYDTENGKSAFFTWDDGPGAYYLSTGNGEISVSIAADTSGRLKEIANHVTKIAPIYKETDEKKVEVSFWSLGEHGPASITRSLDVPTWEDITINYPHNVNEELAVYMDSEWRPALGGQLMLWHGEPGTGKTTALRALARQWRDWCDIHYITDPEQFFGARASYMMNVLVDPTEERWRLLVLEDCGELIAADAKATSGQGLSRLLNAVDGLIGQGLRFMVLITTNEPLKKLNDAVTRPGRCMSNIEFNKLDIDEVTRWLEAHKIDGNNNEAFWGKRTIAELYAETQHFGNKKKTQKVGFGA